MKLRENSWSLNFSLVTLQLPLIIRRSLPCAGGRPLLGTQDFKHGMKTLTENERKLIMDSGIFDAVWYAATHRDVASMGLEPFEHFVRIGIFIGRNPCRLFDSKHYLSQVSGKRPVEIPLLDYLSVGWREHLSPHPLFDVAWYLNAHPDIAEASIEPLAHFFHHGGLEGRQPHPSFPTHRVLERCPHLRESCRNPLEYYLSGEWTEDPCPEAAVILDIKSALELSKLSDSLNYPKVSIVVSLYKTPIRSLQLMLDSVRSQTYKNWELCMVDDGSCDPVINQTLQRISASDQRVKVLIEKKNSGISNASNKALKLVSGEYIAFLDHDDTLEPNALQRCVEAFLSTKADAVYTDQDTVSDNGENVWTFYKPAWSPEYLRHVMYIGHLLVVRAELVRKLNGFDSQFDGVQDFEFMLRLSDLTNKIEHIPEVLYHWHAISGSIAASPDAKENISDLQVNAVQSFLNRNSRPAKAYKHSTLSHRCRIEPQIKNYPKVSIVIPSKDQAQVIKTCLDSIYRKTTYPCFEVIVVDSGTTQPEALKVLASHPLRIVHLKAPFNFSAACNLGAQSASGEIIVFLNNDTEVINENWLEHMVFHLNSPDVGAVGPLLLYPNGKIQHAGVVLGARGTADHVARNFPADSDGYAGSVSCPREVSAVTGACLAMQKRIFFEVGKFSEFYGTHYQDVDLCLKIRSRGMRCIYTPEAQLYHHESISRGHDRYDFLDRLLFIDSWRQMLNKPDPYYPKSCSLERLDYAPR